jgi:hypothetical protein
LFCSGVFFFFCDDNNQYAFCLCHFVVDALML